MELSQHVNAVTGPEDRLWMRAVNFAGLHKILRLIAELPGGIKVSELNTRIIQRQAYLLEDGRAPSATTLYHCRNTLIRLGAVVREGRHLRVANERSEVNALISEPSVPTGLSLIAKRAFAELVLTHPDCRSFFFDLFAGSTSVYGLSEFTRNGQTVVWKSGEPTTWESARGVKRFSPIDLVADQRNMRISLASPSAVTSILYGVRYWARTELGIVDEFYEEGSGSVMFPVSISPHSEQVEEAIKSIAALSSGAIEWTSLSMVRLVSVCCVRNRLTVSALHGALEAITRRHRGYISLIAVSPAVAAWGSRSVVRETYELRGFFRDDQGRYISHIRLHKSLWGHMHARSA